MKTITIVSFTGFCSRGSEALLRTRINSIRKLVPDVNFNVITVYTENLKKIKGVKYIETFGAHREKFYSPFYIIFSLLKAINWVFNILLIKFFGFCFNKDVRRIADSNLFISSDGDVLGEDYGFLPFLWRAFFLSHGIFFKKPIFIYAEGCGPFKSYLGKLIAKFIFKRVSYISLREEISMKELLKLGIKREKINLVADSAFLLEPSKRNDLNFKKNKKLLIGVSVSKLVSAYGFKGKDKKESYNNFINFMAKLLDWLVSELGANIIMICHAIQPKRDDYKSSLDILKRTKNKKNIKVLGNKFSAADFKKAISYCDLLIAARLHAAIAGLSTYVPVIGLAYSHKMEGVFKQVGMENYVIDIKDLNWSITEKIKEILKNQKNIKNKLKKGIPKIKKIAEKPAFVVAEYLNKLE